MYDSVRPCVLDLISRRLTPGPGTGARFRSLFLAALAVLADSAMGIRPSLAIAQVAAVTDPQLNTGNKYPKHDDGYQSFFHFILLSEAISSIRFTYFVSENSTSIVFSDNGFLSSM